ncbi:hypothetical protein GQ457_03G020710 [Hibiscus cannabinus]
MANPSPNPNDFPPLLPGSIPPSNSTSIPPDGGLCLDVVPQVVLERPASPLGGDIRASKKVRGFPLENVDGVVAMEEGNEASQQVLNEAVDGGIGLQRASYAATVSGASEKGTADMGRNGMEDFVLLEEDCIVDDSGSFPSIEFSERVHSLIDASMSQAVIVRLLGRSIGYRTLLSRVRSLWQLKGEFQLVDLANEYYLVKFSNEWDYAHVLSDGPWTIFGNYLTVQPWSRSFSTTADFPTEVIVWVRISGLPYRYYSKALFRRIAAVIGKVVKIDYNTREGERGRFARLAVLVDLTRPLIPCLKIDGVLLSLEYEGLQNICFHCGTYGHVKDSCPALVTTVDPELERSKCLGPSDDIAFGPWMIADTRRRRPKKDMRPAGGMVTAQTVAQGSRFTVLETDVDNQGDRVVAINNVSGSHSALVIHDGKQLKHGGSGALRVAGSSKKGLKVNRGKDIRFSSLSSLSDYVQSIGKVPGVRGDEGQLTLPPSIGPIIIPDDRPFEPGDNHSASNSGRIEDDMEVIEEDVEAQLQEVCRKYNPCLVALLEPRISGNRANGIIRSMGFRNSFRVEAHGFSGGIWVLWRDSIEVEILSVSNQFIHGRFRQEGEDCWAWILGGDFNSILRLGERHGGSVRGVGFSRAFNDFVFENGMLDVEFRGDEFTWRRGNLRKRLDRCLVNEEWNRMFPLSCVYHLDRVGSDHCPILLKTQVHSLGNSDWPFRFLSVWQDHPQFSDFLSSNWVDGDDVTSNIQRFQESVKDWNVNVFGHIGLRKKRILAQLRGIDKALRRHFSDRLVELDKQLREELNEVVRQEEALWSQKSRSQWIRHGDKNTRFFHASTMQRRRRNRISALRVDGSWCDDQPPCNVAGMVDALGNWDWPRLVPLLPQPVLLHLSASKPPRPGFQADFPGWARSHDRTFFVRSAYEVLKVSGVQSANKVWKAIARFRGLQRIKVFIWLLAKEKLLCNEERVRRHLSSCARCESCGATSESVYHIFRGCPIAVAVWNGLIKRDKWVEFMSLDNMEWIRGNLASTSPFVIDPVDWDLRFGAILWSLWRRRNAMIFDPENLDQLAVSDRSLWLWKEMQSACALDDLARANRGSRADLQQSSPSSLQHSRAVARWKLFSEDL